MQTVTSHSSTAIQYFDRAVEAYVCQRGDAKKELVEATKNDASMVVAHALRVALCVFENNFSVVPANSLNFITEGTSKAPSQRERSIAAGVLLHVCLLLGSQAPPFPRDQV